MEYFPVSNDFLDPVEPEINISVISLIHGPAQLMEGDKRSNWHVVKHEQSPVEG